MRFYDRWYDYYGDDPRRLPRSKYWQTTSSRRCLCSGWTLVKISLFLCLLTLMLQILGYTCPGWMIVSLDLTKLGNGTGTAILGFGQITTSAAVWYVRVCTKDSTEEKCEASTHHDSTFMGLHLSSALSEFASIDWTVIQVETTIALALCLVGVILCPVILCYPCVAVTPKQWAVVVAGLMFASGIMLLPPVISMSESTDKAKSAVQTLITATGQDFVKVEIPWAMALTASGMVLAVICCFLLLIAACKLRNRHSDIIRTSSTISEYSDRRHPFVMPTRFSNHPRRILSETYFHDPGKPVPVGGHVSDFPISHSQFQSYYDRGYGSRFLTDRPQLEFPEKVLP